MEMTIAAAVLMGILIQHPLAFMEAAQLTFFGHSGQLAIQGAFAQRAICAEGCYYFLGGVLFFIAAAEKVPQGLVLHGFVHMFGTTS